MNRAILTALLLTATAALPVFSQEEEEGEGGKKLPGIPSRYVDCIQPLTLDILLSAPMSRWGFSGELAKTAMDRIYGIQLCRSFVEETRDYCRQLTNIPGKSEKKMFEKMGYQCATDSALFQTHVAVQSEGLIPTEPRCVEWCELIQVPFPKKTPCPDFCRDAKPLVQERMADICQMFTDRIAPSNRLAAGYARAATAECRMRLNPSPENCTDQLGPMAQKSCREHHAVLEAMRKKDPKLCPKSLRMGPVCAAMTTPEGKPKAAACLAATKAFTVPYCDELKASGGLQDNTKLPSDPQGY